ncbi:hypothetical protein GGU11DRAFT_832543, partial [Lentinula aff. detonsa]
KREREKAAKDLEKRREPGRTIAKKQLHVVVPLRASGSKTKTFKSKSVISDESDVVEVDEEQAEPPRGVKRKRMIKMIAKNDKFPDPAGDFDARDEEDDDDKDESPSRRRPACTRWIEDHSSRRSRGKRAKVEDDVYQGLAARVTDRKFKGPGIAEQLAVLSEQNTELIHLLRRSLEVQEKMLGIMVKREEQEVEKEETEMSGDENDEDGEGEEDEEVNEEKRREEVREGKKRAE